MSRIRRLGGLFAAFAVALAAIVIAAPAQAAVNFHAIPNYGDGKCIDLAAENNVFVHQWHCIGGDAQQLWLPTLVSTSSGNHFELISKVNGGCIGIPGGSTATGVQATVGFCGGTEAMWDVSFANNTGRGWFQQLRNVNSGLCLELAGNSSSDGAIIWQNTCADELHTYTPAQLWMLG